MDFCDELKDSVRDIWENVVTHDFVTQLGDNTLPRPTFDIYFDQYYLFIRDWLILLSTAAAKSPDFESARQIVAFLHLGLGGEEELFQEAFRERGLSLAQIDGLEYRPTTLHYSGYLRTVAYSGRFVDLLVAMLAMEWPYLDWAKRLDQAGKQPQNYYYKTWIDIHISQGMVEFVDWLRDSIDKLCVTKADQENARKIFRDILRYELMFWEMAVNSEIWA